MVESKFKKPDPFKTPDPMKEEAKKLSPKEEQDRRERQEDAQRRDKEKAEKALLQRPKPPTPEELKALKDRAAKVEADKKPKEDPRAEEKKTKDRAETVARHNGWYPDAWGKWRHNSNPKAHYDAIDVCEYEKYDYK